MKLSGWGQYPVVDCEVFEPGSEQQIIDAIGNAQTGNSLIARGAGRSYGDSALALNTISSRYLDNLIAFDPTTGVLRCGAGLSLGHILDWSVPKGWFLPVLPGTRFVTVAGAIASDIHGKNHHIDGCFSEFVKCFSLVTASGENLNCSRDENAHIFHASCGGMGLTGVISDATIQLRKIDSSSICQRTYKAANLREIFTLFEENDSTPYANAWIDCLARGDHIGRSLLYLGKHEQRQASSNENEKPEVIQQNKPGRLVSVPFNSPAFLLNKYSMRLFNAAYLKINSASNSSAETAVHYEKHFFPLDSILNWNRLYGRSGFLQYQFVLPEESAYTGIEAVLKKVSELGKGSFLAVLKKLAKENSNLLSFPQQGYTLALDFKYENSLLPFLKLLDEIVIDHGGRIYLCKDARMSTETFRQCYPKWEQFMAVKSQIDPSNKFSSVQSQRLGLISS